MLKTIKSLQEHGIEVSFMFTLMRQNKDYALQIIDFAEECNVNAVTVERVTPCGHSNLADILSKEGSNGGGCSSNVDMAHSVVFVVLCLTACVYLTIQKLRAYALSFFH